MAVISIGAKLAVLLASSVDDGKAEGEYEVDHMCDRGWQFFKSFCG